MANKTARIRIGDRVTIYQRGKKKIYTADYWWDGQHHRRSLKTRNRRVAEKKAMEIALQLEAGVLEKPCSNVRIENALAQYLRYLQTERRRSKTLSKYRGVLSAFEDFLRQQSIRNLRQVTVASFDQFRSERAKTHSPKSMYNEGIIIKQFLKWCVERELLTKNPLSCFKLRKPALQPKPRPSLRQVDDILAACSEPLRTQLAVLAFTGMRVGQLQRLRPEDIDLEDNWIVIRPVDGSKTFHPVKVPIHPRLRRMLEKLPRASKCRAFTSAATTDISQSDRPINPKQLNAAFQRIAKRLEMPTGRERGFTLHSLRGFFETFCVNSGIPQRVIDTWLGHRSDRSMASVYYCLSDKDSQEFMKQVPFGSGLTCSENNKTSSRREEQK